MCAAANAVTKGLPETVEELTRQVHELEATEGLLSDWSLPGETVAGAAYDVARTVCRRAERLAVSILPVAVN